MFLGSVIVVSSYQIEAYCVNSIMRESDKRMETGVPITQNSLPLHLRSPTISRQQFQSGLKTHLFQCAYIWLLPPRTIEEWTYLLTYLLTIVGSREVFIDLGHLMLKQLIISFVSWTIPPSNLRILSLSLIELQLPWLVRPITWPVNKRRGSETNIYLKLPILICLVCWSLHNFYGIPMTI